MTEHIQYSPDQALVLLDQRKLPQSEEWFECRTTGDVIYALKTMVVRGAPAIGIAAAYGCHLAALEAATSADWRDRLHKLLDDLRQARPTAVNLAWAVDLMRRAWEESGIADPQELAAFWLKKAEEIHARDIETNKAMGRHGADLLEDGDTVMTHCNAGALATAGYGTALGVIRAAVEQGKRIQVIANETRPFLQGARLTAWELQREGIPVTIACDNAVGLLLSRGMVQKIVVGADRIAANGDTANKIGTYTVACLARRHGAPFYVAAPLSTIDRATQDGSAIPIEVRPEEEVTQICSTRITPRGVPVYNFAFDLTPAELIAGIITEKGILTAPFKESIVKCFEA